MKSKFLFGVLILVLVLNFVSSVENVTYTEEMVSDAILESKIIIQEMNVSNFSMIYMKDVLFEAERVFQQVKYAKILRGEVDSNTFLENEARDALRLVDWKNIDYADVIVYTDEIKDRKDRAYLIFDSINSYNGRLNDYPDLDVSDLEELLVKVKVAFYEDRYDEAEELLTLIKEEFEIKRQEASFLGTLKTGSKNFFQRYWIIILVVLIVGSVGGFFGYKKYYKIHLKKQIEKLYLEKSVLLNLVKEIQTQRFKDNSVSELVYNIRVKKYKDRMLEIKEQIPVLEKRLESLKIKKKEIVVRKLKDKKSI